MNAPTQSHLAIALLTSFVMTLGLHADEAAMFAQAGEYEEAARLYLNRAETAVSGADSVKASLNAAACLKLSGNLCAARTTLNAAAPALGQLSNDRMNAFFLAELGSVLALSADASQALQVLGRASEAAARLADEALLAEIDNDRSIASAAIGRPDQAYRWAEQCFSRANILNLKDLVVRARQNQLVAAFAIWKNDRDQLLRIRETDGWDQPVQARLSLSRNRFEACFHRARGSSISGFEAIAAGKAAIRYGMEAEGFEMLEEALEKTRKTGEFVLERACLLALAEVYLDHGRHEDTALIIQELRRLTSEAEPVQEAMLEILAAKLGAVDGTPGQKLRNRIERALRLVEKIRGDLAGSRHTTDFGRSFREVVGVPYMLLAELELEMGNLEEARAALEAFKTRELEDFYRNDCIDEAFEKRRDLRRNEDPGTAILYVIALDDRVELLLDTAKGTTRRTSSIGVTELDAAARRFRHRLEFDYGTYSFMEEAELLHRHIITPVADVLRKEEISHLVYIPDGPLASIPFAALRDPESGRYLAESVSLSIAPGLSLMSAESSDSDESGILLAGLTRSYQGFEALPAVAEEIAAIANIRRSNKVLLNEAFTRGSFSDDVREGSTSIVHLATHAEFTGIAGETFLLTSDGRISISELESLIRPRKFTGVPVDLLCLSACRTAAGDDHAALGLAGAAVKSGARSVVASLWYVDDAAASQLMSDFHRELTNGKNKAEALRAAQRKILNQDPLAHPYLWAPFILIGDWK